MLWRESLPWHVERIVEDFDNSILKTKKVIEAQPGGKCVYLRPSKLHSSGRSQLMNLRENPELNKCRLPLK